MADQQNISCRAENPLGPGEPGSWEVVVLAPPALTTALPHHTGFLATGPLPTLTCQVSTSQQKLANSLVLTGCGARLSVTPCANWSGGWTAPRPPPRSTPSPPPCCQKRRTATSSSRSGPPSPSTWTRCGTEESTVAVQRKLLQVEGGRLEYGNFTVSCVASETEAGPGVESSCLVTVECKQILSTLYCVLYCPLHCRPARAAGAQHQSAGGGGGGGAAGRGVQRGRPAGAKPGLESAVGRGAGWCRAAALAPRPRHPRPGRVLHLPRLQSARGEHGGAEAGGTAAPQVSTNLPAGAGSLDGA